MHPSPISPAAPRARVDDAVAFGVPGVLRVTAKDGSSADLAAIGRDLARVDTPAEGKADVSVRFVDALAPKRLRVLQGGAMGYDEQGVYFLDRWAGAPVARVSQGPRWGEMDVVCTRAPGRIPSLSTALDLAALASGRAPVHGSAWVTREGKGVLVSGWAHSGKTGALLAACESRAVPVGDDRIFLAPDGSMIGTGRPVAVKAWHMAQLSLPALSMGPLRRGLATAVSSFGAFPGGSGPPGSRLVAGALRRLRRSFEEELPPGKLGAPPPDARADVLVILETHPRASIVVERVDADRAAGRVAAQTEAELVAGLAAQSAFRYAFGEVGWRDVEQAPGMALRILEEAVPRIPSYVVRHPYPCALRQLVGAVDRILTEV